MSYQKDIITLVQKSVKKKILFLPHAVSQMSKPERMIKAAEVRHVVENGEVIEDYPTDPRGDSCLMLGFGLDNRPIHVVCSPKEDYLAIVTAYIPNKEEWENNFKKRKMQ